MKVSVPVLALQHIKEHWTVDIDAYDRQAGCFLMPKNQMRGKRSLTIGRGRLSQQKKSRYERSQVFGRCFVCSETTPMIWTAKVYRTYGLQCNEGGILADKTRRLMLQLARSSDLAFSVTHGAGTENQAADKFHGSGQAEQVAPS